MKVKRSIALVIRGGEDDAQWLLVRRPHDDEELPGVWGLPAGSHREGESAEALVGRIGRDKLGVRLESLGPLTEGEVDREGYRLEMRLYGARITGGRPTAGLGPADVTQYAAWGWNAPRALAEGAERGSLCCRLGLELAAREPRGGSAARAG